MKIGFIGGGNVARHLGSLLQRAGHDVALGVRAGAPPGRAATCRSMSVEEAVAHGEVVVLAVPFGALASVLAPLGSALAGKVVVDATNPVNPDWSPQLLGEESSAAEEVSRLLPDARPARPSHDRRPAVLRPRGSALS